MSRVSKLASLPVSLPTTPLPKDVDPQKVAEQHSDFFSLVINPNNFVDDAVWRDTFALTGTIRCFYSAQGIVQAWKATSKKVSIPDTASVKTLPEATHKMELPIGASWVDIGYVFETEFSCGLRGQCTANVSLVPSTSDHGNTKWRIWEMRTVLEQIKSFPNVDVCEPKSGAASTNGAPDANGTSFDVVIVGGGQSGLSAAGRFQALGVRYLLIDRNQYVGDSWNTRYDSFKLHTGREAAHLPFSRTFPDSLDHFLTKGLLAEGYQKYAKMYGIDEHIWLETILESGTWDDGQKQWELKVKRKGQDVAIKSKFVVMAIGGGSQIALRPTIPGQETFKGTLVHSVDYRSAEGFKGKNGVVIGTANTAHDVAKDMLDAQLASVTMVQRSPTMILPAEHWRQVEALTYNTEMPTDLGDRIFLTGSMAISRKIAVKVLNFMVSQDTTRWEGLERAGFRTELYGDIFWHLFERMGGHYVDMGNCDTIIKGLIKMKSDAIFTHFTPNGVAFDDGMEIPADLVVLSVGFEKNMRHAVRRLLGDDTADRMDDFWGIDKEGELRGIWKLQHPGLICHGSIQAQSRFYSRYVALQIKAALEGKRFEQYLDTPIPPKKVAVNGSS